MRTTGIILLFLFGVTTANAQPAMPSRDLKSKSVATKTSVELPYKPDESLFNAATAVDTLIFSMDATNETKKFDFSAVPFIPSKGPSLRPVGDPEY